MLYFTAARFNGINAFLISTRRTSFAMQPYSPMYSSRRKGDNCRIDSNRFAALDSKVGTAIQSMDGSPTLSAAQHILPIILRQIISSSSCPNYLDAVP